MTLWHTAWKRIVDVAVKLEIQGSPSNAEETASILVAQYLANLASTGRV